MEITQQITSAELPENIKEYHKNKLKNVPVEEVLVKTKIRKEKFYSLITDDAEFHFNYKGELVKKSPTIKLTKI